jgi:predicted lipid-binding transport protein (Tim44 family)
MQDLISRIAEVTGVDKAKAEKGLSIILSLIRSHGEPQKVAALFAKLPGADALAEGQARARAGGLLGKLGGGLMGGPLVAVSQLQAAGFSMAQIRSLGSEVLTYAREKAGDRLVREAAGSIPGLSGYL